MESKRPRVSRDTRLLFTIVLISVATLWVLARIRFSDRAATANPVTPVLAQLAPRSAFDDIASAVAQIQPAVRAAITPVAVRRADPSTPADRPLAAVAALRIQAGMAVALMNEDANAASDEAGTDTEVARDPATQLTLLRVPGGEVPTITTWSPRQTESPRFLFAATAGADGVSVRPVFVESLQAVESPLWPAPVWSVPAPTELAPGAFVFNVDGALVGLAVRRAAGVAIVPAETILAIGDRLSVETAGPRGELGLRVQEMSPQLAAAAGVPANGGVIVTLVDPQGPAAGQILVSDVIDTVDGAPVRTLEHWVARVARLSPGESALLTVRGRDGVRAVQVVAAAIPTPAVDWSLGLVLRTVRAADAARSPSVGGAGAEVVRVQPGSAGDRAGIQAGDLLTLFGDVRSPTAVQVSRLFAAAPDGALLLVGVTRGDTHLVIVLERRR